MKKTYFILAIIGFIAPNIWVTKVSIATGNILLWLHPVVTLNTMFGDDINTAFSIDLLYVVAIFFLWSYWEAQKWNIKRWGLMVILTMLFGLAGPMPLFLYWREQQMENAGAR